MTSEYKEEHWTEALAGVFCILAASIYYIFIDSTVFGYLGYLGVESSYSAGTVYLIIAFCFTILSISFYRHKYDIKHAIFQYILWTVGAFSVVFLLHALKMYGFGFERAWQGEYQMALIAWAVASIVVLVILSVVYGLYVYSKRL